MKKDKVTSLAWELFKIRITSSREGLAQDDGVHKLTIEGITSYEHETIEKWYMEALEVAEIVVDLEEKYMSDVNLG